MSAPLPRLHELCLLPTGQIRMDLDPGQPGAEVWVYQRRNEGKGNIVSPGGQDLQLRRKGTRTDRLTSKNAAHRARFAAANAAWQALSEPEKDAYRERAGKLPITGYNLWMRDYLAGNPITDPEFALLLMTNLNETILDDQGQAIRISPSV